MPKIYTVSADSGVQEALQIDTIPTLQNRTGPARILSPEFVAKAVCVPNAGKDNNVDFSADQPAIYTKGLSHCIAFCVAYNKVGQEFQKGYLAHISSPHGTWDKWFQKFPNPRDTALWVVVSVGPGQWGDMIADKLVAKCSPTRSR